jgi:hypothetical protein
MSKYDPLRVHLGKLKGSRWKASFSEIEGILGSKLPGSARVHNAWWANGGDQTRSQSAAWQAAGWRASGLNLDRREVTFVRDAPAQTPAARLTPTPDVKPTSPVAPDIAPAGRRGTGALTFAEAKAGLAAHFGVPPEDIVITIRG